MVSEPILGLLAGVIGIIVLLEGDALGGLVIKCKAALQIILQNFNVKVPIVMLSRSPSYCQDPVWSKIDPLPLPWLHSNHPLRFQHFTNHSPNPNQTPRPLMHYHHSLRTPNNLWIPQSHFCVHHSVLVSLHSNLVFTSPSQFSSLCFWYITSFQYSCSFVLASALPSYISTSLPLNSCNPL